jgi:Cd2+/Zn2+-exporting ATPase
MSDTASIAKYRVGGMDCANCATKIQITVSVENVDVSVTAGTMAEAHGGGGLLLRSIRRSCVWPIIAPVDRPACGSGNDDDDEHAAPIGPWWHPQGSPTLLMRSRTGRRLCRRGGASRSGHCAFIVALAVGPIPIARRAETLPCLVPPSPSKP